MIAASESSGDNEDAKSDDDSISKSDGSRVLASNQRKTLAEVKVEVPQDTSLMDGI